MTEIHQKKETKSTNTVNPIVAGIAGVVVGGMAVAAAVVMSDKKNQKKVKEAFSKVKDQAVDYMNDVKKQTQDKKSEVEEKIAEGKEKAKKAVSEIIG